MPPNPVFPLIFKYVYAASLNVDKQLNVNLVFTKLSFLFSTIYSTSYTKFEVLPFTLLNDIIFHAIVQTKKFSALQLFFTLIKIK